MQSRRSFLIFLNLQFILMEILLYGYITICDLKKTYKYKPRTDRRRGRYIHWTQIRQIDRGAETSDVLPGINSSFQQENGKISPYFDIVGSRNITSVVGQSAVLRCRVKHISDRTVSWIRKRDLHVLTSGIYTFTGDARFAVIHPETSDDWTLEIKYVQKRDAGVYECQVNTEPKMNMAMLLNVEAAQAKIWGPHDVYVQQGSMISLTCSVNIHSHPAGAIAWYHGSNIVDFNSPRGGISLETEKTDAGTTSKLVITKATPSDSGNFTCVPSNAQQASVLVHVLNGEHTDAIKGGNQGVLGFASTCSSSISLTFVIFLIHYLMT